METDISVTNETKLIVETYFDKRFERKKKRIAEREFRKNGNKTDLIIGEYPKEEPVVKKIPRELKLNQYAKHIANLRKVKDALEKHVTVGGITMVVDEKDIPLIDEVIRSVQDAIDKLETFHKIVY